MKNNIYTLITGASEGLGKAMAMECASRNMNLILVALPGPEIFFVAEFIKRNYAVEVIGIEKDLCKDESCAELFSEVAAMNVEVNMLINNAGIGSTMFFGEGSASLYERQIKLNVLATTMVTYFFLPMLKRNDKAYIMNVGSIASFFCLPKKNVYGATKSFIYNFTRSLRKELRKDRIYVSVLCPGAMNTNVPITLMCKTASYIARLSVMEPEKVVPLALDGLLNNKEVIIPGRLNRILLLMDILFPAFIKKMISDYAFKNLKPDNKFLGYLQNPYAMPVNNLVA